KIENVTDLSIPAPGFAWTVSRNYSTMAYAPEGSTAFGNKWFGDDSEMHMGLDYSGNPRLVVNSSSARIFQSDGVGGYISPPDSGLQLVREQYQPSPPKYRYVVTDEQSDAVYVFYDLDGTSEQGRLWERTTRERWAQKK